MSAVSGPDRMAAEATYNPWTNDDSAIGLKNAVLLAEKTGLIFKKEENEERQRSRLEEMPSVRMIQLQKTISEHNARMHKVNFDIQRRTLYHETKDLTDVGIIERRTGELKRLADHLLAVSNNKEALVSRLQQPHVGTYIKLEAAFHKHASEVFYRLAPILSDLTSLLDDLSWVNSTNLLSSQLDGLVMDLSGALARLETQFQAVSHMSQCVHNLHANDESYSQTHLL